MRRRRANNELDADERDLIEGLYPSLRRFASTVRSADQDGNDLVQEALLRVLEKGSLERIKHPTAYIRRVILNLAIDHSRSRERERRALARHGPPDPEPLIHSWDLDELRTVPAKARAAIFLHAIEGRSYADIAETLGCSQVSARVAASRGRQQLRTLLGKESRDAIA
jgi:RNA polymerase sigma-70 factor (ECF subfamily)